MHKDRSKKLKSNKSKMVTANVVAEVVGCTPRFVHNVWAGDYNKRATETQENIEVATLFLEDGTNKLIQEVKKILA
jgi:hypothetical protein